MIDFDIDKVYQANLANFYLQLKHPRIDQALKLLHKAEQQKDAKEYFKKVLGKAPDDEFKKHILQELDKKM